MLVFYPLLANFMFRYKMLKYEACPESEDTKV